MDSIRLTCKSQENLINDKTCIENDIVVDANYDELNFQSVLETNCNLKMLGSNLLNDSPIVFYVGENGERLWNGLQQTGTRLVYFPTIQLLKSSMELYKLIENAASYVFDYSSNSNIYFVGHGIGALLITKLLADRDFFLKNSRADRLQAAFLISGIYNSISDTLDVFNDRSNECGKPWLSFDNVEDLDIAIEGMNRVSPLFDNFDHLLRPGVRLYVFAAGDDEPQLKVQSRQLFDRFLSCCDQGDLHFEIKEKVNRTSLLDETCKPNSFLGRLIRYDICLSQTR